MNLLKKLLLSAAFLSLVFTGNAQSIELTLTPSTQVVEIGQTAKIIIKAKGIDGFNGQIFLKISSSDMPNAKSEFSTDIISSPYTDTSTLSITPFAGTEEKTYSFTIDAYNGTLKVSTTTLIAVKKENCVWGLSSVNVTFVDNKGEYWGGELPNLHRSSDPSIKFALPNYEYRNTFIDADNNFWFATNKGIVKFDGKSATVLNLINSDLPFNDINFVIIDSNKTMWIANQTTLYKKNIDKWANAGLNLEGKIHDLKLDRQNKVWLAVSNNIYVSTLFQIYKDKIIYFNNSNSCLPQTGIFQINFDLNNALWAGLSNYNNINDNSKENSILKFDGNTWEFWCRKATKPYNHYLYDNTCKMLLNDNTSGYDAFYNASVRIDGNNNKWMIVNGMGSNEGIINFNDKT